MLQWSLTGLSHITLTAVFDAIHSDTIEAISDSYIDGLDH